MKSGRDWREGWAAHSSLELRTFAKDNIIANTLRSHPWLCYYANHSALFGEVYGENPGTKNEPGLLALCPPEDSVDGCECTEFKTMRRSGGGLPKKEN